MMNILLWSPAGSGEHYNGPASFSHRLYSYINRESYSVTLAHGYKAQEKVDRFIEQRFVSQRSTTLISQWRFIRKARRFIESEIHKFDLFHGIEGFHTTVAPAYQASKRNVATVLFLANHKVELADKAGLRGWLGLPRRRRQMVANMSALIAMSSAIYEELISYGFSENRIARIPMGTDTSIYRPITGVREKTELRAQFMVRDLPTVIFAGGVTRRKRPDLLIEAIGHLHKRNLDIQLLIVGPESDARFAAQLRQRITDLGIGQLIVWIGFSHKVADLMRASDIFALPSEGEGMPAALVEAMATSLPCIVTAISGCSDLIRDGVNGRVVSLDATQIADVLMDFVLNPVAAAAMGQVGRRQVEAEYSLEIVARKYQRLFESLIDKNEVPDMSGVA